MLLQCSLELAHSPRRGTAVSSIDGSYCRDFLVALSAAARTLYMMQERTRIFMRQEARCVSAEVLISVLDCVKDLRDFSSVPTTRLSVSLLKLKQMELALHHPSPSPQRPPHQMAQRTHTRQKHNSQPTRPSLHLSRRPPPLLTPAPFPRPHAQRKLQRHPHPTLRVSDAQKLPPVSQESKAPPPRRTPY